MGKERIMPGFAFRKATKTLMTAVMQLLAVKPVFGVAPNGRYPHNIF